MPKSFAQVAHYRVLQELGAGGMGIVLLAEDTRLHRRVALKVLPPDVASDSGAQQRLLHEARLAAAIDHPNICAIYEVGEDAGVAFIAMQYVEGDTLAARLTRGKVSVGDTLRLAGQVASGLAAAHERGIVHRDLKPSNIVLTSGGDARVLDFGLALYASDDMASFRSAGETAPRVERLAGTLAYMSPEQLRGEQADGRSDMFAFGLIVYEMLTGERPFARHTTAETITRTLTEQPKRLQSIVRDVPGALAELVDKCLSKEPQRRPSSQDAARQLIDISTGSDSRDRPDAAAKRTAKRPRTIESIAVLPFENATGDAERDYVVDGITESIINHLSRVPRLRVIARSTVFRFKTRDVDVADFGRLLDVQAVLTGRVAARSGRVSVSAELVGVRGGEQLWGDRYEFDESEGASPAASAAEKIAADIRARFRNERRTAASKRVTDPEAFRLYLQGRFWWNKRPQEGFTRAIEFFQQSIERDPLFAAAYAGLADAYASLGSWEAGLWRPRDALARSLAAAHRAIDLEPKLAEAHAALCYVLLLFEWKLEQAKIEAEHAIELNPNNVNAHHFLSHIFMALGAPERSLEQSRITADLDPLDTIANVHLAWHFWMSREPERAIEQCRRTLELDPNSFWPKYFSGLALELQGEWSNAIEEFTEAQRRSPAVTYTRAALGHALANSGDPDQARTVLRELADLAATRYVPAYDTAIIHIALGEGDEAFAALEKARQERSSLMAYLDVDPRLDPIRTDSRFAHLRNQVGLPG